MLVPFLGKIKALDYNMLGALRLTASPLLPLNSDVKLPKAQRGAVQIARPLTLTRTLYEHQS